MQGITTASTFKEVVYEKEHSILQKKDNVSRDYPIR